MFEIFRIWLKWASTGGTFVVWFKWAITFGGIGFVFYAIKALMEK